MTVVGVLSVLDDLTNWLADISGNWWFYPLIFTIALLDSIVPVVPSETTVIIGGVAAGQGRLWIALVIVMGATGAFCGDSIAYFLGNRFRPWVVRRLGRRNDDGEEKMERAAEQLRKRGGMLLITARFIPGGRTLMTLSCGATRRPYKQWFVPWDVTAAVLWAAYAAGIGYFFGGITEDHSTAFWLAFGTALGITGLVELVRWLRHRSTDSMLETISELEVG